MLWMIVLGPVNNRPYISNLTPIIPRGSLIPSNPSTVKSCGNIDTIWRSGGIERTRAAEATFLTSSSVISFESPLTAIIPWQFSTSSMIWIPAFSSACRTARCIAWTVLSISTIMPRLIPSDFAFPTPIIFIWLSIYSATTTLTDVVPISRPTYIPVFAMNGIPSYLLFHIQANN